MKACLHTFCALLACLIASNAAAVTATDTPTETLTATQSRTISPSPSASPTITPTATRSSTPGIGRYVVSPAGLGNFSSGNELTLQFFPESATWASSGGLLTVVFPAAFSAPVAANFYAAALDQVYVSGISYSGQTATVTLHDLGPGNSVTFRYGYNATGFEINGAANPERFLVYAHTDSTVSGPGGLLQVQPTIQIFTPNATRTPTPTRSPTRTTTPDWTATATFSQTPTCTVTPTWTESPVGAAEQGVYSYPNPFDLRLFEKCTFRFPADADAKVTVFNLVGEPVRELPLSDIQGGQGWAIWNGVDDQLRKVPGGLYFVRIRGKETHVRKFTVHN